MIITYKNRLIDIGEMDAVEADDFISELTDEQLSQFPLSTRPQSEREKLGLTREEFGKKVAEDTQKEIEGPTGFFDAMFPRSMESGGEGLDATQDVLSFPGRALGATMSSLGDLVGGDTGETFYEAMARTGADETSMGEVESFGENILRDPLTWLPTGTILKGAAKIPQVARAITPVAKGARPIEKLSETPANLASMVRNNVDKLTPESVRELQGVIDNITKLSPINESARAIPKLSNAKAIGTKLGLEGAIEAGGELALNDDATALGAIMAGVVPAAVEGAGRGIQKIAKSQYGKRIAPKPSDQGRRFSVTGDEMADYILSRNYGGEVPFRGYEPTLERIRGDVNNINIERARVNETLAPKIELLNRPINERINSLNQQNELFNDISTTEWTDSALPDHIIMENIVKQHTLSNSPQGKQMAMDMDALEQLAEQRNQYVISDNLFSDARADVLMRIGKDIDYDDGLKLLREIDRQENNLAPFSSVPNINTRLDESFMDFFGETPAFGGEGVDYLPTDLPKKRWFDEGQVNRQLTSLDPSKPRSVVGELLWENLRRREDQIPEYAETAQRYAEVLPVRNALENRIGSLNNQSFLDKAGQGVFSPITELIGGPATMQNLYNIGDIMRTPLERVMSRQLVEQPRDVLLRNIRPEDEEKKKNSR